MSGLLDADQNGEFRQLFAALSEKVFLRMYSLTRGDRALSEDLVQDAFIAAAKNWTTIRPLSQEQQRAWLFKVAQNKAIDNFRHREVERKYVDREGLLLTARESTSDAYEEAISSLTLKRLWEAIGSLPRQQQMVCFLRFRAAMSYEEIAKLLGCSMGNVSALLSIASKRLIAEVIVDPICGIEDPEGGCDHG